MLNHFLRLFNILTLSHTQSVIVLNHLYVRIRTMPDFGGIKRMLLYQCSYSQILYHVLFFPLASLIWVLFQLKKKNICSEFLELKMLC